MTEEVLQPEIALFQIDVVIHTTSVESLYMQYNLAFISF